MKRKKMTQSGKILRQISYIFLFRIAKYKHVTKGVSCNGFK